MKKALLFCMVVLLPLLIGCEKKRVKDTELREKYRGQWYYEDAPFTGEAYMTYENGQIKWEWNYKDGKQDGRWVSYYENGKIFWEANYKDGKLID